MNRLSEREISALISAALSARRESYSPYSGFAVGAAVLCEDGEIYGGCNIESSSYPVGICAERAALSKAVSCGERSFRAVAVVGGSKNAEELTYCYPCGMCRQFMSELCDKELAVIVAKSAEEYKLISLGKLLPFVFKIDRGE